MTSTSDAHAPVASIIVPSYRGGARLHALLDSLAGQEDGTPSFEVIVVVDGIDDGSVALVEGERRLTARAVLLPTNQGRVAALNTGFDLARGDVLIRCDDDLVVPRGFVRAHVEAHRSHPSPVAVVGATRDVHRHGPFAQAYGLAAAEHSYRHATSRPEPERWRHWAANCSIDRRTWERVGRYDTAYRAYGWEDVDYGYRIHAAGIEMLRVPETDAEHHGPARTASARAVKAFDAGAARATFHLLHPEAPIEKPQPGAGLWGRAVDVFARTHASSRAVRRTGRMIDAAVRVVPRPLATKLVALAVEGAGLAGTRASSTAPDFPEPSDNSLPRIAIAHDYLTQRGGAERLVLSIARAFPEAQIHTLFYEPSQTYPEYLTRQIRTSPLNRIGLLRRDPRRALPILAPFASRLRIDADVVIASSSGWAHAFPAAGKKVVYCHSPARWLYLPEDYLGEAGPLDIKRLALAVLSPALRRWDHRAARTADRYIANSTVVRDRIRAVYGIDAPTVFPPFSPDVAEGGQEPIPALAGWAGADGADGGHYLVVSRLQPYKHVDRIIEAFRGMSDRRLLVIGKGPEKERLQAMTPPNVRIVEGISDAQMRWAYANACALIAASHEDFGLTPLEAAAHGVPTLALRAGGYLDTIAEGINGLFFEAAEPADIQNVVARLDGVSLRAEIIRERGRAFSEDRFIHELQRAVCQILEAPECSRDISREVMAP